MLQSYYTRVKDFFRNARRFVVNVWRFRKALWNHRWWDHHGILHFMEIGIDHMATNIESRGIEIKHSRRKKVAQMRRVVEILGNIREFQYFDIAEQQLGVVYEHTPFHFTPCEDRDGFFEMVDTKSEEQRRIQDMVFDKVDELERSEWNELWDILKGPDYTKFDTREDFDSQYDGSGLNAWWD